MIAGKDMAELGRPVPQRNLGGHADLLQLGALESADIANRRSRLAVELQVYQCRSDEFDGGKALVELSRRKETLTTPRLPW